MDQAVKWCYLWHLTDLTFSDDKVVLFPRLRTLSHESCFVFANVEGSSKNIFILTEWLNEHCQLSFALRAYITLDEDLQRKKGMQGSCTASVSAKKCFKGFIVIDVISEFLWFLEFINEE